MQKHDQLIQNADSNKCLSHMCELTHIKLSFNNCIPCIKGHSFIGI